MALGCLVVVSLIVANLRRGRAGRRLIAVRTNERAAAALGISVPGGEALRLRGRRRRSPASAASCSPSARPRSTSPNSALFNSITMVAYAMIGGIGYLFGPVIGATLAPGRLLRTAAELDRQRHRQVRPADRRRLADRPRPRQPERHRQGADRPDRLPALQARQADPVPGGQGARAAGRCRRRPSAGPLKVEKSMALEVKDLTVKYGGTVAVDNVSLTVKPGQVIGLIGPNGAGKTSLIDAVTGFTKMSPGSLAAARRHRHQQAGRRCGGPAPAWAARSSRWSCSRTRPCSTTCGPPATRATSSPTPATSSGRRTCRCPTRC